MVTFTIKVPTQSHSYIINNILSSTSEEKKKKKVFLIKHKFRLFLVWKQACRVTVLPHSRSSSVCVPGRSRYPHTSFRDINQSIWCGLISDVVFYSLTNCVDVSVAVESFFFFLAVIFIPLMVLQQAWVVYSVLITSDGANFSTFLEVVPLCMDTTG